MSEPMTSRQQVQRARLAVLAAVDAVGSARRLVGWMDGYRAGTRVDGEVEARMRQRTRGQVEACNQARAQVSIALAVYARAIRAEQKSRP